MGLFNNTPTKIPAGVNCDKCGRFIGQDGEVDYEHGEGYCGIYIVGGTCGKCLVKEEG